MVLILLSAFFSGTETAIVSSSRIRLETFLRDNNKKRERAIYILDNVEDAIGMILIGNNVANIAATAFITFLATKALMVDDRQLLAVTVFQTIVFLVFCEVLPKIIARVRAETYLMFFSLPIKILMLIASPINRVSLFFSRLLQRVFNLEGSGKKLVMSREEIDLLFMLGHQEGVIDKENKAFVSEILSIRDITAFQIMTPVVDIVSIDVSRGIRDLVQVIENSGFSRIPVYNGRVDNIIGYVYYKDILAIENVNNISDLLVKAVYVPSTISIHKLYLKMQDESLPMVFVVDEYGGIVGMIADEDIAEEIVGEIHTSDHAEEDLVRELEKNKYLVDGSIDIDYFQKLFSCKIQKKGFVTIAGYILDRLGRIPVKGEKIINEKLTFVIEETTDRSIEKIIVITSRSKKIK